MTSYERKTRVIFVFVDGTHKKTINIKLLKAFIYHEKKIVFNDRKRLSTREKELLNSYYLYHQWCDDMKIQQPHLYTLIHHAYPIGSRKVLSHNLQRYELLLNNSLKVKCTETLHNAFEKFPTTYSNY